MEQFPIYGNRDSLSSPQAGTDVAPLPRAPSPWNRLPASWRQWSFGALGVVAFLAVVVWLVGWRLAGRPTPAWYPAVCAGIAAGWIATIFPGGLVDRRNEARIEEARRRHPGRPWMWDHPWDPRGVSGRPLRRVFRTTAWGQRILVYGLLVALMATPAGAAGRIWATIGGLAATWIAWRAWRVYGVGTAHVGFTKFPYHPGERVTLLFGLSEGGAHFERAEFVLRRIEEIPAGQPRPWHGVWFAPLLWERRPSGELPGGDRYVKLNFDVPASEGGTNLSALYQSYWVLDVRAVTSAGPYVESFLVPIYERPAAPVAA